MAATACHSHVGDARIQPRLRLAQQTAEAIEKAASGRVVSAIGLAAVELAATPPQQPQHSDVVEAFASQLTPRSASWVRAHPEYVRNPRLNQKMIAAHQMALADGMEADTDEYFGYVEDMLQVKNQPHRDSGDDPMSGASKPAQRRSSPAAAPVSRNMNSSGTKSNVVTLTPEMREIAKNLGQTPEEYAKNRLALIREGRINGDN